MSHGRQGNLILASMRYAYRLFTSRFYLNWKKKLNQPTKNHLTQGKRYHQKKKRKKRQLIQSMSREMVYDSSLQVERNCSIGEYMVEHNLYHLSTTQNPNCVRALLNFDTYIPTKHMRILCTIYIPYKVWRTRAKPCLKSFTSHQNQIVFFKRKIPWYPAKFHFFLKSTS
jgi:hypothetical protein